MPLRIWSSGPCRTGCFVSHSYHLWSWHSVQWVWPFCGFVKRLKQGGNWASGLVSLRWYRARVKPVEVSEQTLFGFRSGIFPTVFELCKLRLLFSFPLFDFLLAKVSNLSFPSSTQETSWGEDHSMQTHFNTFSLICLANSVFTIQDYTTKLWNKDMRSRHLFLLKYIYLGPPGSQLSCYFNGAFAKT